ncbi:MAG: hypothetical protein R3211_12455, partial [Balneolaceae bacterium]|nr:hypothetical protein [Balneolaceae bacterium]
MVKKETILNLIEQSDNPSISIYLPTHKMGEEVQQDPIRLKNLLSQVDGELENMGMSSTDRDKLLEEPRKLFDKGFFWQHSDEGLALFITNGFFEYYRIPIKVQEEVLIDDHFLITPVLPMISTEGTFCVLALSRKNIRLLKATRNTTEELDLDDTPTSMEEYRQYNEYEKSLSSGPGGTAPGGGGFHGWGDVEFDQKEVESFLIRVETGVTDVMKRRNDPLILAGIDQAVALYQKANHYDRLLDSVIDGNPDPKKDEQLRDEAWEIIQDYFLQNMYEDMKRYANLIGSDRQSDNLTQIVESAYYGKVDTLFIPIGERSWGWFDKERDVVHHSAKRSGGEHDLINAAAIMTLKNGGDVYALPKDEMPQE